MQKTSEYYSAEADWMQNNTSNIIPQISLDVHPVSYLHFNINTSKLEINIRKLVCLMFK